MPRDVDGKWYPPRSYGWREWKVAFTEMVAPNNMKYAAWMAQICETEKENPMTFLKRWAYWHGAFERGEMIPPNWPEALTPGDWKSLVLFSENETKNKRETP
jgi:hypothetical protein